MIDSRMEIATQASCVGMPMNDAGSATSGEPVPWGEPASCGAGGLPPSLPGLVVWMMVCPPPLGGLLATLGGPWDDTTGATDVVVDVTMGGRGGKSDAWASAWDRPRSMSEPTELTGTLPPGLGMFGSTNWIRIPPLSTLAAAPCTDEVGSMVLMEMPAWLSAVSTELKACIPPRRSLLLDARCSPSGPMYAGCLATVTAPILRALVWVPAVPSDVAVDTESTDAICTRPLRMLMRETDARAVEATELALTVVDAVVVELPTWICPPASGVSLVAASAWQPETAALAWAGPAPEVDPLGGE